jgi:2-keto-4-pentenoate hydratase
MTSDLARDAAKRLWAAELAVTAIDPLSAGDPPITPGNAYDVQLAVVDLRRKAGHHVVGKKIGVTSVAMQRLSGVMQPDYGHLFDVMDVPADSTIKRDELLLPRVEPELAFVLKTRLPGPYTTPAQVLRGTEFIAASLEIVDTRIKDWKIRWADTVADNGSSARFVLSDYCVSPLGIDYASVGAVLRKNGRVESTATLAEVLGSPLRAVAWLARKLAEFDIALEAGDVILSGSPLRALDAEAGDSFEVDLGRIGRVGVAFT